MWSIHINLFLLPPVKKNIDMCCICCGVLCGGFWWQRPDDYSIISSSTGLGAPGTTVSSLLQFRLTPHLCLISLIISALNLKWRSCHLIINLWDKFYNPNHKSSKNSFPCHLLSNRSFSVNSIIKVECLTRAECSALVFYAFSQWYESGDWNLLRNLCPSWWLVVIHTVWKLFER